VSGISGFADPIVLGLCTNWRLLRAGLFCAPPEKKAEIITKARTQRARDPDGTPSRHCDEGRPIQRRPGRVRARRDQPVFDPFLFFFPISRARKARVLRRTERCQFDGHNPRWCCNVSPPPNRHRCHAVGLQHRLWLAKKKKTPLCQPPKRPRRLTTETAPSMIKRHGLPVGETRLAATLPDPPASLDCFPGPPLVRSGHFRS